jgi:hypothetical protein
MNSRKCRSGWFGFAALSVMAAIALAAGGVSSTAPGMEGTTTVTAPPTVKPGVVIGKVVSADPTANLSGVHVALVRDGKAMQRTMTNEKGEFKFDKVAPGRFTIAAAKREVGSGRELSGVRPGETARVLVKLRKPQ